VAPDDMYESMTPVASACELRCLDGHRLRADELGDARGRRAVSAPFQALQIGGAVQGAVGKNALRGPRHGVEQLDSLLGKLVLQNLFRSLVELHRVRVAGGEERNAIQAEQPTV